MRPYWYKYDIWDHNGDGKYATKFAKFWKRYWNKKNRRETRVSVKKIGKYEENT